MSSENSWTILSLDDISLKIYYTLSPAEPATRDPGGNLIDPPTPASVEISGIYLESKESDLFDLFSYSTDDLEALLLKHLSNEEDS